jgi:hypothetical protein
MPYPTFILVTLNEINGSSCGTLSHRMELTGSSPPQYTLSGSGSFTGGTNTRVDLGGGNYTWELAIRYSVSGPCRGNFVFGRTTAADDPTGDFCRLQSGTPNCSAGKATSVDDS